MAAAQLVQAMGRGRVVLQWGVLIIVASAQIAGAVEVPGIGPSQSSSINGPNPSINGPNPSINGPNPSINGTSISINGTSISINGASIGINGTSIGINGSSLLGWVEREVGRYRPDPTEGDVGDEDHLPRRPIGFDDRVFFGQTLESLVEASSKPAVLAAGRFLKKRGLVSVNATKPPAGVNATGACGTGISRIIVVAKDGSGRFRTVQAAVDSVAIPNTRRVLIYVKKGIYNEKVSIPAGKDLITLKGESPVLTFIQWNDTASTLGPGRQPLGTYGSASVSVHANSFIALDISFKNTAPHPPAGAVGRQAVALMIEGDRAAFYRCNFYGAQDTLYDKQGRHYYYNSYIEGSVDFIFGDARSLFVKCQLHSIANPYGSISAQKRSFPTSNTGYSFVSCVVSGSGYIFLGRTWGPYSRVIFSYTFLSSIIRPEGWDDFGVALNQKTAFYGEYKCSGPGASRTGRVSWSHQLTDAQAKPFLSISFIDGGLWLPKCV